MQMYIICIKWRAIKKVLKPKTIQSNMAMSWNALAKRRVAMSETMKFPNWLNRVIKRRRTTHNNQKTETKGNNFTATRFHSFNCMSGSAQQSRKQSSHTNTHSEKSENKETHT